MDQPFYGTQETWHTYLIGGVVTLFVLVSAIIGLVEGISENLPQHIILVVVILMMYFVLYTLYRWWGEGDLDPKFRWLMLWVILTIVLGCIVLNVYSFTVQANDSCDDDEPPGPICDTGLYQTNAQTCITASGNCTGSFSYLIPPGSSYATCVNSTSCKPNTLFSLETEDSEERRTQYLYTDRSYLEYEDEETKKQRKVVLQLFEGWQVHAYPLYSSNPNAFASTEPHTSPSAMKEFLMFQTMYEFIRTQQKIERDLGETK